MKALLHRQLRKDYAAISESIEAVREHMRANPGEEAVTIKPKDYLALMEFKRDILRQLAKVMRVIL